MSQSGRGQSNSKCPYSPTESWGVTERKDLTEHQLRFLNFTLDYALQNGKWPTLHQVERGLRRDFNAFAVARELQSAFGDRFATHNREAEMELPFQAIAHCANAEAYYAILPRALAIMREIYFESEEKPQLTSEDLRKRGWAEEEIARVGLLLRQDWDLIGSSSHDPSGYWRFDITDRVRDYPDIRSPREYIEARLERETMSSRPVTRTPRSKNISAARKGRSPRIGGHTAVRSRVFIVHGHDEALKSDVARTLEKLDVEPIILHEQANVGRTIIEKFESFAEVDFAVVLVTPDDLLTTPEGRKLSRARQNVILEMGFFLSSLGRERVFILRRPSETLELPSDYDGVVYTPADESGAWKLRLAQELRAAGIAVDANRL